MAKGMVDVEVEVECFGCDNTSLPEVTSEYLLSTPKAQTSVT